jgi:hypothetical protein
MRAKEFLTESTEKKYTVTYDYYGTNPNVPLYTKFHTVRANTEQEAINTIKNLVGGRNHKAKEIIVQEDPEYGLPTLDKHRYSVLDKLVKDARKRDRITSKAIQNLDEEIDDNKAAEIAKAVEWVCKKLNIKDVPAIELSMDTEEAQGNHHTGGHVPGSGKIWIYAKNRNLVDILRTTFHELVHVRQHELDMIKPDSSYPGSPIEAMADMMAGKMIKNYGADNPHIFE